MFFQKKTTLNLTKLYLAISPSDKVIDFDFISTNLFKYCINPPSEFAINFGKDKDISRFKGHINLSKFETLSILDIEANEVLAIRRQLKIVGLKPVLHLSLLSELNKSFINEVKLIDCLKSRFGLVYGYSRFLRSDFSTVSETKIKRGLLSITVNSEKPEVWLFKENEIENGAIKGVYPLNCWTSSALQKLADINFQLPESFSNNESNAYLFSEAEQREILDKNPKFRNHVRFDDLGT